MITPKFKLSQSESELVVTIYTPFARIADTEVNIDESVFIFYSSPYYLRLHLPGKLVDSEKEVHKATFVADEGAFLVTCMKQTFGEFFPGLDMLTDLLTPKESSNVGKPIIEVLSGRTENDEEEEDFEFFFEQKLPEDSSTTASYKYGFANSHSNVFSTLRSELANVLDIVNPDKKSVSERKKERLKNEEESFADEHYLADLHDQDIILPSLNFEPLFHKLQKEKVEYTSTDEETLLKLPRKELLIDKGSRSCIYLALVDIMFSWCYDHRVTVGETCTESAWNIRKLSSTLSWLDTFCSLKEVVSSSVRRSLVFPLMRNWELSLLVLQDTIKILSLGKKQVLKCLLEIQHMFNNYEPYYILNELYITDFCVWIQTVKEKNLISIADSLKKIKITKEDMALGLVELELGAEIVIREEEELKQRLEEEAKSRKVAENNLNNLMESMGQLSVIENALALSRNDNDIEALLSLQSAGNVQAGIDYSDESSDDSTDDSSDESEDSDSSDSDDDSDSSSSSSSSSSAASLDSDDDSDEADDAAKLIIKDLGSADYEKKYF